MTLGYKLQHLNNASCQRQAEQMK